MLAGLTTGHMIGLSVVAATFIVFALVSSFVAPRLRPDFPGKNGMSVYIIACFVLFGAMLTAVEVFGVESEAKGAEAVAAHQGTPTARTIKVEETEFKIGLPVLPKLAEGEYTFVVHNAGKVDHDLVIEGGKATGPDRTRVLKAGETAKLVVSLAVGNYTLYCSVAGHRQAGMVAKLSVG